MDPLNDAILAVVQERDRLRAENEALKIEAKANYELFCDGDEEIGRLNAEVEALKDYLRMIEHATGPSPDDGGYHENAYTLAMAALRGEGEN